MKHKFLTEQIITYLGNKRKLIPFIEETIDTIIKNDKRLKKNNINFFDIFSGSGIVSRFAKLKGFQVYSNDLESYSYIINKSLIGINKNELDLIFSSLVEKLNLKKTKDNYLNVINFLNTLNKPENESNFYFSKYYAPKTFDNVSFETERLFYTPENALIIDSISEEIFKDYWSEDAKNIILSSLMYKMTKHINTSGTMKGFHNGWGGSGKAAIERITKKIKLEKLPLINGKKGIVYNDYAEKVFQTHSDLGEMDIIYADPPYNQHQYSANYNHLTTLVKNDKYKPGKVVKGSRAGIRKDHKRSSFCSLKENKSVEDFKITTGAKNAFKDFINNVKTKYIVMSYNNEGVVNLNELLDILSNNLNNTITIKQKIYDKFKGGKSTKTSNKVIEYLIIIKMNEKQSENTFKQLKDDLLKNTLSGILKNSYLNYKKLNNYISVFNDELNNVFLYKNKGHNLLPLLKINNNTNKILDIYIKNINISEILEIKNNIIIDKKDLFNIYYKDKKIDLCENLLKNNFKNTENINNTLKISLEEKLNNLKVEIFLSNNNFKKLNIQKIKTLNNFKFVGFIFNNKYYEKKGNIYIFIDILNKIYDFLSNKEDKINLIKFLNKYDNNTLNYELFKNKVKIKRNLSAVNYYIRINNFIKNYSNIKIELVSKIVR